MHQRKLREIYFARMLLRIRECFLNRTWGTRLDGGISRGEQAHDAGKQQRQRPYLDFVGREEVCKVASPKRRNFHEQREHEEEERESKRVFVPTKFHSSDDRSRLHKDSD